MILAELEREIKPLSKEEKAQLMHFLIDEITQAEKLDASQYFQPGDQHGFWSAYNEYAAAEKLQELLETHTS